MRLQRLQTVARSLMIASAAAAAAISLVNAVAGQQFALAAAVLAALLVRLQGPTDRLRHAGAIGLVLAVAAVVGVQGGPTGPALLLLLLVVADYAIDRATSWIVGVSLVAGGCASLVAVINDGPGAASLAWIWVAVLVAMVGLTAGRLSSAQSLQGTAALESATAALDEVLRLAERMPAGFDRWSVATAVQQELDEAGRVGGRNIRAHLLLVVDGVLFGVRAPMARQAVGLVADLPAQRRSRVWTTVSGGDLPMSLTAQLGGDRWYLHRLGGDGAHGVVLLSHDAGPAVVDATSEVLRPAGVALANVHRFERLEDLALSAARLRLAHDLHDGVAQALTHVRFELDLLALGHDDVAEDVNAIREVADAALLEVRRTVDDLREDGPVVDRLRRHVELLSSVTTADITLDVEDHVELEPDCAEGVFRIAQEALSNAVRHADATTILVSLAQDARTVSLDVVDDGSGIASEHRGVGLSGMRTRARRLGAELVVRPRRGGGTVVHLEAPLGVSRLPAPEFTETDTVRTKR